MVIKNISANAKLVSKYSTTVNIMNDPYEINWKVNEPIPHTPNVLYKYRDISQSHHLETLTEFSIFLPSALKFNDPFDCKIPLEYLKLETDEELRRNFARKLIIMYGSQVEKDNIEYHVEQIMQKKHLVTQERLLQNEKNDVKKLNTLYGIYSVSANPSNLLLWSHYANSHTGICIGFNTKKLFEACKFSSLGPITYFKEYPNMSVLRDNEDLYYNQLYNKSIDWSYEQEFRYVKINGADTKVKITTDIIEEIYLGCMISKENEILIHQIKKQNFPSARLYKCKKSKSGYYLERDEI